MVYAAPAVENRRAEMWFDGPARQHRWTVLLRLILFVPQYVVLSIISIACLVVAVIGWFAALAMGRLPEWAHAFLTGFVRWNTRVAAYLFLLTDRYPPFSFDDEPYPVRPMLPANGRLNRWAVLFRLVLLIPAAFFATIVVYGLVAPLLVVTWVIILVSAGMPPSLYWAYSALVRYLMRFHAFAVMLTSEYPWGMLGDREPNALAYAPPTPPFAWPGDAVPPAPTAPAPVAPPAPMPQSEPALVHDPVVPPPAAPAWPTTAPPPASSSWPPPPPPVSTGPAMPPPPVSTYPAVPAPPGLPQDRGWLVLPSAARGWLIFAIVWGSILFVTQTTINSIVATNNLNRIESERRTVLDDFNNSQAAVENAITTSQHCATVACLRPSHLAAAASLQRFVRDLRAMNLPSNAQQPAQLVENDASQLASGLTQLANSASAQDYRSIVQSSQINTLLRTLPNDTNSLLAALNHDIACPPQNGLTFCAS